MIISLDITGKQLRDHINDTINNLLTFRVGIDPVKEVNVYMNTFTLEKVSKDLHTVEVCMDKPLLYKNEQGIQINFMRAPGLENNTYDIGQIQ